MALLCTLGSDLVSAAPYVPASDDEILITLPSMNRVSAAGIATTASTHIPDAQRIKQAQALLASAFATANEDAFGQTQALLTAWADDPTAEFVPLEVQYMLAVIMQHNHQFAEALQVLDAALRRQADFAPALMQRAQIHLVIGNYQLARKDCVAIQALASMATAANCMAQVAAVTGRARETYERISSLEALQSFIAPAEYAELLLTLATVSHRLGLQEDTERYYRVILENDSNKLYATLQYSDFLLEQQRFDEALQLLAQWPANKLTLEMQVKQLEALRGSGEEQQYSRLYTELAEVFAIARTRADNFPHKEYARFLLVSSGSSAQALQAARANWQYQKEPADLLLLVRTAVAANSSEDLATAREWIVRTGLEDQRISGLLDAHAAPGSAMQQED